MTTVPVLMFYKGKNSFSSSVGGICTIFTLVLIIAFSFIKLRLDGKISNFSGIKYSVDPFVENVMLKSNASSLKFPKIESKITNLHINRSPRCDKNNKRRL